MERSKRSLNVRMNHGDDYEMNKAQTWATVCVQLSRKTIKGKRHSLTKREITKTKDLQCMKTHALASATLTLTCSPSVAGHFTHCWVSLGASCCQFLILVAVTIYSISTCTRIPCRDSHCENGSFEVLSLHSGRSWSTVDGLRHRSPPGFWLFHLLRRIENYHLSSAL